MPKLSGVNNKHLLLITASLGQEFRCVLARQFWLRVLWDSSQDNSLSGTEQGSDLWHGSLPQFASWCWLFVEGLSSSPCGILHRATQGFSWHGNQISTELSNLDQNERSYTFYVLALEVTHCHLWFFISHTCQLWLNMEENYIKAWIPGIKDHWGPSWRLSIIPCYTSNDIIP